MNKKEFTSIVITIGLVIIAVITGYLIGIQQNFSKIKEPPKKTPRACTEEAKQCPDGSYVGRTGPNCEFDPCPESGLVCTQEVKQCPNGSYVSRTGPNCEFEPCQDSGQKSVSQIFLKEGQRESSLLVEKIYPDQITGLNFPEHPIPLERGLPITLRIGETASDGCTISLTLTKIEGDVAVFIKKTDFDRPCPICLSGNSLIDTPSGSMAVKDLKTGMSVWTMDKSGQKVPGVITKTSKVPVPQTHQMVRLVLNDGRQLLVSPGHPTVDGRAIGNIAIGDLYDGALVTSTERVSYKENATYDILPSGETGFYWANGILIGSTLR